MYSICLASGNILGAPNGKRSAGIQSHSANPNTGIGAVPGLRDRQDPDQQRNPPSKISMSTSKTDEGTCFNLVT